MAWRLQTALALAGVLLVAGCVANVPLDAADAGGFASDAADFAPAVELLEAVREAVAAGRPVALDASPVTDTLGRGMGLGTPRPFVVTLRPSLVTSEGYWTEVNGSRVEAPFVEAYEGEVVDHPEWPVRLTLTREWSRGSILVTSSPSAQGVTAPGEPLVATSYLVRVGLDGNLPYDSYPSEPREAETGRLSRGEAPAPTRFDPVDWPEEDCLELVPPYVTPVLDGGAARAEAITARIVLEGDAQLRDALHRHAFPILLAMLQETDIIYQHEVGIRFSLVGIHLQADPEAYPDPAEGDPVGTAAEIWNERTDVDRDVVHYVSGQESSYGVANCIGGAGKPEIAYTFTPLNWERNFTAFHTTAFAHELGHIFSAHHHYGNHVETGGNMATLMIQGYTPGIRPVFSTLSKSVIRGWAEEHVHE